MEGVSKFWRLLELLPYYKKTQYQCIANEFSKCFLKLVFKIIFFLAGSNFFPPVRDIIILFEKSRKKNLIRNLYAY